MSVYEKENEFVISLSTTATTTDDGKKKKHKKNELDFNNILITLFG